MVKKQDQTPLHKTNKISQLDKFQLGFEFDKTLGEIRSEVRSRTHSTL